MVLQQSPPLIPHKNPGENAKKSCYLDTRSIQNIAYRRTRSYCGTHPYKAPPTKLASRSQLHSAALPENHLIKTLMDDLLNTCYKPPPYLINTLTDRQKIFIKGYLMDSNNKLYRVFPSFFPLNPEFNPGSRIIDIFPD